MTRSSGYLAALLWVLVALAVGHAYAATQTDPLAREGAALAAERIEPGSLVLESGAVYEQAVVTLVGPNGYRSRREFGAGVELRVSLRDESGSPLESGRYRYILQVLPRPSDLPGRKVGVFYVSDGEAVARDLGGRPQSGPTVTNPQGMIASDYLRIDGSNGYPPAINFAEYGYGEYGTMY
jgi:hypothetical protein